MSPISKIVLFVSLSLSAVSEAQPVYKYFLKENEIIASQCNDEGESTRSKINISFEEPKDSVVAVRLRVKACTHKYGLKKFVFTFDVPVDLFNENTLLELPINKTKKVGKVWITREENIQAKAVYSLSPESFGSQADGVKAIRFYVATETVAREDVLIKSQGRFVWQGVSISYKKGFFMPTVNLRGDLSVVEEE